MATTNEPPFEGFDRFGHGALMEKLGIEWLQVDDGISARIPVETNTQPLGYLHGGASACLAETLASVGSWLRDTSKITFGIEIKINHLRTAREGFLTGVAIPLKQGRNIDVWEIRMTGDDGSLIAFATCTIAIRPAPSSFQTGQ